MKEASTKEPCKARRWAMGSVCILPNGRPTRSHLILKVPNYQQPPAPHASVFCGLPCASAMILSRGTASPITPWAQSMTYPLCNGGIVSPVGWFEIWTWLFLASHGPLLNGPLFSIFLFCPIGQKSWETLFILFYLFIYAPPFFSKEIKAAYNI